MPRPKGAGKADPRFGRISSRIIDEIAGDEERRKRLFRRIDRLQSRALKLAFAEGGLESFGPDGPMGPPPCSVAATTAKQVMEVEELRSRILARQQEIDAKATALFMLLRGDDVEKPEPMKFVVEITDPTRPKVEDLE